MSIKITLLTAGLTFNSIVGYENNNLMQKIKCIYLIFMMKLF